MEPTKPIVQTHNMHQLSNALYQSLSASNIHLAGKPHLNLLKKIKRYKYLIRFLFTESVNVNYDEPGNLVYIQTLSKDILKASVAFSAVPD